MVKIIEYINGNAMNLILPSEKKFMSANIKDKNIKAAAVKLIDILFQICIFFTKM